MLKQHREEDYVCLRSLLEQYSRGGRGRGEGRGRANLKEEEWTSERKTRAAWNMAHLKAALAPARTGKVLLLLVWVRAV